MRRCPGCDITYEASLDSRFPTPDDRQRLIDIAGTAFQFGRYHADPRFPRNLADLRYRVWVESALSEQPENTRIFVVGPIGHPVGFLHVALTRPVADLRLAGVNASDSGIAGPELFLGALKQLRAEGIERVTARLSAANTSAINLYAAMSFRFHEVNSSFTRGTRRLSVERIQREPRIHTRPRTRERPPTDSHSTRGGMALMPTRRSSGRWCARLDRLVSV